MLATNTWRRLLHRHCMTQGNRLFKHSRKTDVFADDDLCGNLCWTMIFTMNSPCTVSSISKQSPRLVHFDCCRSAAVGRLRWELEAIEDEASVAVIEELLGSLSVGAGWETDYYL